MADIVYAENAELVSLKPEFEPAALQHRFEQRIAAEKEKIQRCSEDGFVIKTTLNDLKKDFNTPELASLAEELEQKSPSDLQAMLDEHRQTQDGEYNLLHEYAEQLLQQSENKQEIADAILQIRETERYAELSRNYGEDFSYLYQLSERALSAEMFYDDATPEHGVRCHFAVIDTPENTGIMSQAEKFRQDAMGGIDKTLVLQVQMNDELPFNLAVKPFDELDNETQKKVQLVFSEETVQKLTSGSEEENKARLERIFKFCDDNGISVVDMSFPVDIDGYVQVDEKLHSLMEQVREKINAENLHKAIEEDRAREEELKQQGLEYSRDEENDLPPSESKIATPDVENVQSASESLIPTEINEQENSSEPFAERTRGGAAAPTAPATRKQPHTPSAEKVFTDMAENDLGRQDEKSYFRRRHSSWNVYVFYDKDVRYNKPVEQDKKGNIQYNYAFKLYFKTDDDGVLHLSYRTPNGRKVDPLYTDTIAGKLKDLNVTHFRIPKGWRADDVGIWRKSLAEKGIVPTGISLNKAKVETMLKAAKEKLSEEAYDDYKYKLGMQMERYNRQKGKHPDLSEQTFIDGLIACKKYGAFIRGYNEVIKPKMRHNFRTQNGPDSAVDKISNFHGLARLYAIYKANMNQAGTIGIDALLTPEEKRAAQAEGVDLHINVKDMPQDQMGKLFDALQKSCRGEIEKKIDDALVLLYDPASVGRKKDTRPARTIINQILNDEKDSCKGIIDDLLANGQDELKLVEAVGSLEYDYESRHTTPATPRTSRVSAVNAKETTDINEGKTETKETSLMSERQAPALSSVHIRGRDSY